MFAFILLYFYPRDVVSGVFATATWLGGWLGVCHSRYGIKTTKPILKLFLPSGIPIIEAFGSPCPDTKFQWNPFSIKYMGCVKNWPFSTDNAVYLRNGVR